MNILILTIFLLSLPCFFYMMTVYLNEAFNQEKINSKVMTKNKKLMVKQL